MSEMVLVSRFLENAANLLDAAQSAVRCGVTPSHLTILLGCEGGLRMIADSDWPLDSLQAHHGASMVFRVTQETERVRVEGRDGARTCRLETPNPAHAAKMILRDRPIYSVAGQSAKSLRPSETAQILPAAWD